MSQISGKATFMNQEEGKSDASHLSNPATRVPLETYKKCIEVLTRNIDRMRTSNKEYYQDMLTRMVSQDIRDEELMKIVELL